ncbi:MAG: hypothetical protein ACKO7S_04085, partial [Actinomycetota bacterium]
MTLNSEVRELASSVAKRHDHGQITKLHVLFAIRKKLADPLAEIDIEALEKRLADLPRLSTNQIAISEEVEGLLRQIQQPDHAVEIAINLAKEVLGVQAKIRIPDSVAFKPQVQQETTAITL